MAVQDFDREVISCRACPRLVQWREDIAVKKTKRFADEEYWGKPVPSFGSMNARLLIIGLAPAAHGANRTGRMFTGDRSGEWLYEALYSHGFASQPASHQREDGLTLVDTRITAVAHCAPPQNVLTRTEIAQCNGFLKKEFEFCRSARVYIALGSVAYREVLRIFRHSVPSPKVPFSHGARVPLSDGRTIFASYHPSQQNTFTGRLTKDMFHHIFRIVSKELAKNSYI